MPRKISEGQRVRVMDVEGKRVIEPVRDAVWLAFHGKKIGKILSEEIEESLHEQERLSEDNKVRVGGDEVC